MSDLLGVCRDFEFQGSKYKVPPADLHVIAHFCDWVVAEAGRTLARMKPQWPAEFYAEQMRMLNTKIAGKRFGWGSEDTNSAVWSDDGHKQLLWLKITRGQEKGGAPIERETLDLIAKDKAKWEELTDILYQQDFPDFFAALKLEREMAKRA